MRQSAIYELCAHNWYVGLTFVDERDYVFPFEGSVRLLRERAPSYKVMFDRKRVSAATKVPDCIHFLAGFLCVRSGVWQLFSENLAVKGDCLDLTLSQAGHDLKFVLFEPERWFDFLDLKRSNVEYFDVPPYRVKYVDNVVLRDVSTTGEDIFRVEHMPARLFCTQKCVDLVKEHKLTGFDFRSVRVEK